MKLREFAENYVKENRLKGRTPIYSANRFERLVGEVEITYINSDHLTAYRLAAIKSGLAAKTIENSINDLLTLVKAAAGRVIEKGKCLRIPKPQPNPVPIDVLDLTYRHSPRWLQQFIALSYWTGLRLADAIEFQMTAKAVDPLRWAASKTEKQHIWPLPEWVRRHLVQKTQFPYHSNEDHNQRIVRNAIDDACRKAGVARWTPKQLRQKSVSEWSRVNAAAGAIVHGKGLGVIDHYVDPLIVLEPASAQVRVPEAFLTEKERAERHSGEEELVRAFSKMDGQGRELVLSMVRRMG